MIDRKRSCQFWCALLCLIVTLPAGAEGFNTSFFIRLTTGDGEVLERQSRLVLQPGKIEENKSRRWGIAFAVDAADSPDEYRLTMRVLEKMPEDGGFTWKERAGTVGTGSLDAPFDLNLQGTDLTVESNFYVSRVP